MVRYEPQHEWQNWMGNLRARLDLYEPRTIDELRDAVVRAADGGKQVRPVGGSCAWSPLVPNGASIIGMRHLQGVRDIDRTSPTPTITVQCGWPVRKLVEYTRSHGLTLVTPPIFQGISLGGALAVGAHGTGLEWSTMADTVRSMRVMTADGVDHEWTAADGDLFDAARVGLGCFGLVHEVTLECEPEFRLHVEDRLIPRADVLSGLDDLLATYEFVELYWFPFNETMWVKAMSRTIEPVPSPQPLNERVADAFNYWAAYGGSAVLPWLANLTPALTPSFMKLAPTLEMTPGTRVEKASDEFHYQRAYPKCWNMSWAVPLADSAQAWRDTMALIEDFAGRGQYPINMCVHSRFMGASKAWMSPAYGRKVCDIEVATMKGTPGVNEFFDAWTDQMLANPGARPHWGKVLRRPRALAARYPRLAEFLALRATWDPAGVFMNDFLRQEVFQLP